MSHKTRFDRLDDVDISSRADGFVTYYDLASGDMKFIDPATFTGATDLDGLTDVTLSSPTAADRLRYNGAEWQNSSLTWMPLSDGDPTSPSFIFAGGEPVLVEVTP